MKLTWPVLVVRTELAADDSLAEIRARSKFGIAMAAMIRMIATTISNSISEKPFCFRIVCSLLLRYRCVVSVDPVADYVRTLAARPGSYLRAPSVFPAYFVFKS